MIIPHTQMSASKWYWEMLSMWRQIGTSYPIENGRGEISLCAYVIAIDTFHKMPFME
jgi:hypothetical protein